MLTTPSHIPARLVYQLDVRNHVTPSMMYALTLHYIRHYSGPVVMFIT